MRAFVILGLGFVLTSQLSAYEKPHWVHITKASHNGSGCRLGSDVSVVEASNPDRIHVDFKAFSVTTDDSVERKNCSISLNVDHPGGWQYAVKRFDAWIMSKVNNGAEARVSSNVYHQGDSANTTFTHRWHGWQDGHFDIHQAKQDHELIWSSCREKRSLNTNTSVLVKDAWATAKIKHKIYWGLVWRRC
ncbi:MAG: DUF4360 domain-containing protein [Pseudobacteriovorax sp.]|nr:DUF4360 domain-containing protein [Pseudobacteriovorax sp.]